MKMASVFFHPEELLWMQSKLQSWKATYYIFYFSITTLW